MKKIKNGMTYKGHMILLNSCLINAQNLSKKEVQKIVNLHKKRIDIFKKIKKTEDKEKLKELAKKVDKVDIKLQKTWKFEKDFRRLSWWVRAPKCTCSINQANLMAYKSKDKKKIISLEEVKKIRPIALNCPLHGII